MLNENQKQIRKIAWSRLTILKKFVGNVMYTNEQKIKYIEDFRTMYSKSTLDDAGLKMANNKLDKLKEEVK